MEIKSKKYINEGFNSKAYIINDEYILLEGVNKNSYDNYKKYSESLNKLVDVKSLQIPNIIELIAPNNEFPNGAMVYKMIKGHTFTKSYIDKVDKEQLAKKLADFMNELYEVPVIFDKKIYVEQELNNAKINLELLREYLDDEKYSLLLFFASTFSSKMQSDFLKVAWGISPVLHFPFRHSFRCRRGAVAGIQSLLVTDM